MCDVSVFLCSLFACLLFLPDGVGSVKSNLNSGIVLAVTETVHFMTLWVLFYPAAPEFDAELKILRGINSLYFSGVSGLMLFLFL